MGMIINSYRFGAAFANTNSLLFGGGDERSEVSSAATALELTGSLTISTWIKPTSLIATYFISKAGAALDDKWYYMYFDGGGVLWGGIFDSGGTGRAEANSAAGAITSGVWQQVSYTYDGTNGRVYVNEVLKGTSANYTRAGLPSAATPFFMGQRNGGFFYEGYMTHTSVWNIAKSSGLITASKPANLALDASYANCVGWWRIDGDTYPNNIDSKNGNTGVMTNMEAGDITVDVP